jgi:hypothetical protein
MISFEQFSANVLHAIARGRKIEYNNEHKAFEIRFNPEFVRTVPLSLLMDEWRGNA